MAQNQRNRLLPPKTCLCRHCLDYTLGKVTLLCQGLLHILIEIRFSSRTVRSHTLPLPVRKHQRALANCRFASIVVASKLVGLQHLGSFAGEWEFFGSPKNGNSEANHSATTGYQGEATVKRNRRLLRPHLEKWVVTVLAHI